MQHVRLPSSWRLIQNTLNPKFPLLLRLFLYQWQILHAARIVAFAQNERNHVPQISNRTQRCCIVALNCIRNMSKSVEKRGSTIAELKARFKYAPPASREERYAEVSVPPQMPSIHRRVSFVSGLPLLWGSNSASSGGRVVMKGPSQTRAA